MGLQVSSKVIDAVSVHACERYVERIIGIPTPEKSLSFEQTYKISKLLLRILLEVHPKAMELGEGKFVCKDYDMVFALAGNQVVTIHKYDKDRDENGKEIFNIDTRGGIHNKNKKRVKSYVGTGTVKKQNAKKRIKEKYKQKYKYEDEI